MSCLTAHTLGSLEAEALDESDRATASAHLDGCIECRSRRDGLKELLAAIGAPELPAELAPKPATWRAIAETLRAEADAPRVAVSIACSYCKGRLARPDAVYCAACLAPHHHDCWQEHGACSSCHAVALVRPEVPRSPWHTRRSLRRPLTFAAVTFAAIGAGAATVALRAPSRQDPGGNVGPRELPAELARSLVVARARMGAAVARRELGDPAGAIAELRAALAVLDEAGRARGPAKEVDAARSRALRELGDALLLLGTDAALDEALAVYARALEHGLTARESARTLVARGSVSSVRGDPARAIEDYSRALVADHQDVRAYIERARAKAALGDTAGALEDLTAAVDLQPSSPEPYLRRAEVYRTAEKHKEAIQDYGVALERNAGFFEAYLGLGQAYEETLDYERAVAQYDAVLESEDGAALAPRALAAKAHLAALRADPLEIRAELDHEARRASRSLTKDELTKRVAELREQREGDARRGFDEALRRAPRLLPALVGRARLALSRGETVAARSDLEAALAVLGARPAVRRRSGPQPVRDAELATVHALVGHGAALAKRWDEAIRSFEAALAVDDRCAFAAAGLALAWNGAGDATKAKACFEKARVLEAATADHRRGLEEGANALRSKRPEQYARARSSFARAVALDSYHALAYLERGRLAAAWRAWDLAIADASRAIEVDPFLRGAYELRGRSLTDRTRAIADFTKAIELGDGTTPEEKVSALHGRALAWSAGAPDMQELEAARLDVVAALRLVPGDLGPWMADANTPVAAIRQVAELHDLDARIHEKKGDAEIAKAATARAAAVRESASTVARDLHEKGKVLRDARSYTDALARFDRAIELAPTLADAYYDRGTCHSKLGNFVAGILDYSRSLELNPRFADQFYNKTYQVSYVVDLERVIAELDKIVADHPDESHVVFLRGFFFVAKTEFKRFDQGDLDKGIRDFDRTLELNPKHVSARTYRGFLEFKSRRYGAALEDYEEASRLDPESGLPHYLTSLLWSVRSQEDSLDEAERTRRRELAVKALTASIEEKGFAAAARVKNEKGFGAIKDDPRVVRLINGK